MKVVAALLVVVGTSLAGAGCRDEAVTLHSRVSVADSAGVAIVDVPPAQLESLPEWHWGTHQIVVGAGSDSAQYILNLAGMPWTLESGRIVVPSDQYEIRYFSSDGQFERTVGRYGLGPEEYEQLWSVFPLGGDTTIAIDIGSGRALVFDERARSRSTAPICAHDMFGEGRAQLSSAAMTLLLVDWANRSAATLLCVPCGHIEWFMEDPQSTT